MTDTAEAVAPEVRQPPADPEAAKLRRALSARAKAALLADLRDLWRDCNEIIAFIEVAGEALKAGRMTEGEVRDYLGPEFIIWMAQVAHARRRNGA